MTLEKLVSSSDPELQKYLSQGSIEWEKLTDEELENWTRKYWHVTRPTEVAKARERSSEGESKAKEKADKIKRLNEKFKRLTGEDLGL